MARKISETSKDLARDFPDPPPYKGEKPATTTEAAWSDDAMSRALRHIVQEGRRVSTSFRTLSEVTQEVQGAWQGMRPSTVIQDEAEAALRAMDDKRPWEQVEYWSDIAALTGHKIDWPKLACQCGAQVPEIEIVAHVRAVAEGKLAELAYFESELSIGTHT